MTACLRLRARTKSDTAGQAAASGSASRAQPRSLSLIGETTEISGTIVCAGEVRFNGRFDGDIICQELTVGESAEIYGEVTSDRVRIQGIVTGQVRADTLALSATAQVTGELLHRSLAIEPGAFVDGTTRRFEPAAAPLAAAPSNQSHTEVPTAARAKPAANRLGLGVPRSLPEVGSI